MKDLIAEINKTIDQLITNVQVLHSIAFDPKFGDETQSLQKTQESLLAKLLELDKELENLGLKTTESDQMTLIEDKLAHFGKLNQALITKTYDHYSS